MLINIDNIWWILSLKNPSPVELSFTDGVGGFLWPISVRAMRIAAHCYQLTKRAPNSASIALASTLVIVVYLTIKDPLSRGCFIGGLLGFACFLMR